MCGICGYIKREASAADPTVEMLTRMNDAMIRRGPDGGRVWLDPKGRVGLGHRRLSIIDLSDAATQPMANEDGSIMVVFNGEIYNHAEIREQLSLFGGHTWRTDHSDTEVILHAYEEWGMDCLDHFRGMFAFVLWDARKEVAYAVRDRVGIKPLFWMERNGAVLFASDANALLAVLPQKPGINEQALYDYLTFRCTPEEDTLFAGIHKVRPATYLTIPYGRGTITRTKYYDFLEHTREDIYRAAPEDIEEALLAEFRTSARLRKASDVPVGVFLSGGVDSSTNAVIFAEGETKPVETFSVGYDKEYPGCSSEYVYARRVARQIGAHHHEITMDEQLAMDFLDGLIDNQSEPLADPVCIPLYYVSKFARENGVLVCHVGEGADELFGGYRQWLDYVRRQKRMDFLREHHLLRPAMHVFSATGKQLDRTYDDLWRASAGLPIYWMEAESPTRKQKERLLSRETLARIDPNHTSGIIRKEWRMYQETAAHPSQLGWMACVELWHRLPELLLMRVDAMSMAASIETRVPFLDHKMVELALSIPDEWKIRDGEPKYILKKSIEHLLPHDIIYRKKQGFGLPVSIWLSGALGDEMQSCIRRFADATGLLDETFLQSRAGKRLMKQHAWTLYNVAAWWERKCGA